MAEPIGSFISGERLKIAELQDYVIDIIYDNFQPDALLYGGTAIWRCFGGQRFSDDISIYMDNNSFNNFTSHLEKYDLKLIWRDPEFPSRILIARGATSILLETKPGSAENDIRAYSRIDGTTKTISVLSPTELMIRKMEAYSGRLYIRDIYDLFILTSWLDKSDYLVRKKLSEFLNEIHKPVDKDMIRSLLYAGRKDLNFTIMINYISGWLNEI